MKTIHCAECGAQLHIIRKVFNRTIYNLILPHKCEELEDEEVVEKIVESKPVAPPPNLDAIFKSFKFVQKLNDLKPEPKMTEPGDRRPKDSTKSTAPTNLLEKVRGGDLP